MPDPAPVIVTATLGDADFARLDALRRAHFPPERNHLSAHLTLFHHLPPSLLPELDGRLREAVRAAPPAATLAAVMSLGRGVAYRIDSPALAAVRADLADAFAGLLTPQDQAGWRPHVTIQNKVAPEAARALQVALSADFRPAPLAIVGLASHYYRGGPWEPIKAYRFRAG
ncbi:2'-5' RNA ligase family protein [Sphingomonas naphthae]|uniref:2'-5' RNA ligase family protein n=1 Tax=Sphingomonas naphthae TaxID=1813468 RepID=A0ABY7TG78_9SPHN|nr:2'-5' RNA ligase family protein [Sphingomonas naphthae]WCT71831.1 2'-5' RNA ligase family protein [Sphingomonas naphthae]